MRGPRRRTAGPGGDDDGTREGDRRSDAGFGRAAARPGAPEATFSLEELNGESALLIREEGRLTTAILFTLVGEWIEAVRAVRNPEKLAWLERRLAGA